VGGSQAKSVLQSFANNSASPLQSIANAALLNLSGSSGSVHATLVSQSEPMAGAVSLDIQLSIDGPSDARQLTLSSLQLKTTSGTGRVMLFGPVIPLALGYIPASALKILRIVVSVPSTVTAFSVKETFQLQNGRGKSYSYSQVQTVTP
jgi:hypothetical protein